MKKIVFVCTGNTCRSPMAEGYLKSKRNTDVISRGLAVGEDEVSPNSIAVMKELSIDISDHIPRQLSFSDIDGADAIVCMSSSHADILEGVGVDKLKIHVLGISDPYGGDLDTYRRCRDEIVAAVDELSEDGIL